MKPRRDDSEFIASEFDSALGYPGEDPPRVPDFGSMERCNSCDLAPWRVSRGGNEGKCERCKNVRKRGTEVHADHDSEMSDQNDTAEDDEMLHDGACLHVLESLREMAKKNMP